jgi:adenosine deaminase
LTTAGHRPSDLLRGSAIPDAVLTALPKTDLHVHLDGSLRADTFRALGRACGLAVPDDDAALARTFFPEDRERCQLEFLRHFDHTLPLLQRAEHLERVARELVLDHAADGCRYLEVRFCPLLHGREGLTPDAAVAAVRRGLAVATEGCGARAGIIVTGLRTIAPAASRADAELAVAWKGRGVVGFDLAGAEEHYPAKDHREAFYHVMNNNQNVTIHAGEGFGPASIHQALHRCGANRIGHGTRLPEDAELMAYVADFRVPVEICPSSAVASGVIDQIAEHPLRTFLEAGLRVCLGTDNTLFARTSPQRELRRVVDAFDLTLLETEHLLLNGFKSAFLPERAKADLVEEALATFAALRDEYGLDREILA